MTSEDIRKAFEAIGKAAITVNGDLVLEKHVDNEIGNVEPGGIGIQNNYYGTDKDSEEEQPDRRKMDNPASHRQAILDELLALADKGDWAKGISLADIKAMLTAVLGMGDTKLTDKQAAMSEKLWVLLECGRKGDNGRVRIIWQNIVGFLDEKRLLVQKGATALNKDFFGDTDGYTNIDKGRPKNNNMSNGFREILPLLEAFVPKLPNGQ